MLTDYTSCLLFEKIVTESIIFKVYWQVNDCKCVRFNRDMVVCGGGKMPPWSMVHHVVGGKRFYVVPLPEVVKHFSFFLRAI